MSPFQRWSERRQSPVIDGFNTNYDNNNRHNNNNNRLDNTGERNNIFSNSNWGKDETSAVRDSRSVRMRHSKRRRRRRRQRRRQRRRRWRQRGRRQRRRRQLLQLGINSTINSIVNHQQQKQLHLRQQQTISNARGHESPTESQNDIQRGIDCCTPPAYPLSIPATPTHFSRNPTPVFPPPSILSTSNDCLSSHQRDPLLFFGIFFLKNNFMYRKWKDNYHWHNWLCK